MNWVGIGLIWFLAMMGIIELVKQEIFGILFFCVLIVLVVVEWIKVDKPSRILRLFEASVRNLKAFYRLILSKLLISCAALYCLLISFFAEYSADSRVLSLVVMIASLGVVALVLLRETGEIRKKVLCLIYGGLAVIFNPVFRITDYRDNWHALYFLAFALFTAALFLTRSPLVPTNDGIAVSDEVMHSQPDRSSKRQGNGAGEAGDGTTYYFKYQAPIDSTDEIPEYTEEEMKAEIQKAEKE